jgi:hypothetical protein
MVGYFRAISVESRSPLTVEMVVFQVAETARAVNLGGDEIFQDGLVVGYLLFR